MLGADIVIYAKQWCPECAKAKALLRAEGLEWRERGGPCGAHACVHSA